MSVTFYLVGGVVRDTLDGKTPHDIDRAVVAPSWEAMVDAVTERCRVVWQTDEHHQTMRGFDKTTGGPVDFARTRKDGPSTDGRHPDYIVPGTIEEDLARRDFTVNAMAMDDNGNLLDLFGGRDDLATRTLRFVGDPVERLGEDSLRAFRAIRFAIVKGFTLDPTVKDALESMTSESFGSLSTDRIRDELFPCFAKDTVLTLSHLGSYYGSPLLDLALERGIWLKPTMEKP